MSDPPADRPGETEPGAAPDPPAGYGPPWRFAYPALGVNLLAATLTVVSLAGFGWLALALRRADLLAWVVVTDTPDGVVLNLGGVAVAFVVGFLLAVPLHEAVHGAVATAFGYRVSYGVATNVGGVYAAAFGQFQPREHLIPVALAPLVVLDAVGVALVAFAPAPVAAGAVGALVVNTSGAAGDLYATTVALRTPPGTLFYDVDMRNSYVFEPAGEGDGARR
ncbi:DUF3267 domain-containing protein [Candidatus Halobonum tyrrellensis]|uniref:DUF3267 domain-containing protein n=1 Tax=Candidatus Halobonum tyrrellensis G22 TaxID=1324957 RepID=V4HFR4_9EURY|nr:DUF3267 domain-containing protein [Candidatus Halobonum tyrrellensis]ESP88933.1 hypothetical protein K933_06603 [Candidatus Halobonum tyrrellensis G22]